MGRVVEITTPLPAKSGKKAAILSVIAPVIAVMLNITSTTDLMRYSIYRPSLAAFALIAAWAGFLAAIVGLVRGLSRLYTGAVVYSLAGLVLNAGLLAMAFGIMPGVKGLAGYSTKSKVTMLQLNSLPQVFEDSTTVFNPKYGFRLEQPAGFVENPDSAAAAKAIHSFVRYDDKGRPGVFINVERLRRILAPRNDKPSVDQVEEFMRAIRKVSPYAVLDKVEQEQWKTHTVDVFLVDMPDKGEMMRCWFVEVPLAREAIRIQVGGLNEGQSQCPRVLRQILKSLQGSSNWD